MGYVFSYISSAIAWVVQALAGLIGTGFKALRLDRTTGKIIGVVLLVAITLALGYYSDRIVGMANLPGARFYFVARFYLGIVFVLVCAFVALLIYLIRLFLEKDPSWFPDIDEAWAAGLDGLAREGLDLHSLPIFLVAGLTEKEEPLFFTAGKFSAKVVAPQAGDRAALHFYANREALFITCTTTCATARQVEACRTGAERPAPLAAGEPADLGGLQTLVRPVAASVTQRGGADSAAQFSGTLQQPMAFGATLLPGARVSGQVPAEAARQNFGETRGAMRIAALDQNELDLQRRRLAYLCRLIREGRDPLCPINGALFSIPLDWTDSSRKQDLLGAVRQDVRLMYEELRLFFPVVCLLSGVQELPGFNEFIDRVGQVEKRLKYSRAGSSFPMGHAVNDQASSWLVGKGLGWFRGWIYTVFARDLANKTNTRLYRLLCQLDDRRQRLVQLLKLTLGQVEGAEPVRFAGCYFGAFGADPQRQAFISGVLEKIMEEQDNVAWSYAALEADFRNRRLATAFYLVTAVLLVADGVLLWFIFQRP